MNDLLQSMAVAGGPGAPGGQWACSSEYLEGLEHSGGAGMPATNGCGQQHMKELAFSTNAIDCATLTLPSASKGRAKQRLRVTDIASSEDMVGSTDEARGALNGSLSRPHSESSGEFSLDHEVWSSSGSSPTQQHPSSARCTHQSPLQPQRSLEPCGSPAQTCKTLTHDVLSLQQFLKEGIEPAESGSQENMTADSPRLSNSSEPPSQRERPPAATCARGILRSASSKASERPPRLGAQVPRRPTLRKTESTRVSGSVVPRASLALQGRAVSVSDCLDATTSALLPRASSVISTAEGSTRRTSVHEMLSKDSRQPVSVDASPPATAAATTGARLQPSLSEYPPLTPPHPPPGSPSRSLEPPHPTPALPKSMSLPCSRALEEPDLTTLESFLGPSFTVESVFKDSIFSQDKSLPFLSLNPTLVSNISGPPPRPNHPGDPQTQVAHCQSNGQAVSKSANQKEYDEADSDQSLTLSAEDKSLWYEYGCV
ncbi:Girdin [Merluccius polli]|uniref:Girdin n=1 Tax=Merluccius polli TaxID=89951 RepID=A0AA47N0M6_MERPO|nr:Girdin [Merluccius polli]